MQVPKPALRGRGKHGAKDFDTVGPCDCATSVCDTVAGCYACSRNEKTHTNTQPERPWHESQATLLTEDEIKVIKETMQQAGVGSAGASLKHSLPAGDLPAGTGMGFKAASWLHEGVCWECLC